MFLRKSGKYLDHPRKLGASLGAAFRSSATARVAGQCGSRTFRFVNPEDRNLQKVPSRTDINLESRPKYKGVSKRETADFCVTRENNYYYHYFFFPVFFFWVDCFFFLSCSFDHCYLVTWASFSGY